MRNELDFAEHSRLLGEGLFADKVLLALYKFSKTRQLTGQESDVLKRAEKFLNDVLEGGRFSVGVFHSNHDVTAAKAFTHAVSFVAVPLTSKSDLLHYIDGLRKTIEKILANEHINDEELAMVDTFFSRYSKVQFQQSREMLESV